eukprot:2964860-Prorocentrum_lima.AAC.1
MDSVGLDRCPEVCRADGFLDILSFLRCLKPSLVTRASPGLTILGGVGLGEGNPFPCALTHTRTRRSAFVQDCLP